MFAPFTWSIYGGALYHQQARCCRGHRSKEDASLPMSPSTPDLVGVRWRGWKPGTQMTFKRSSVQVWYFMRLWWNLSYCFSLFLALKVSAPGLEEFGPRFRHWLLVNPLLLGFDGVRLPKVLLLSFMLYIASSVTNYCISPSPNTHFHPVHLFSSVQLWEVEEP